MEKYILSEIFALIPKELYSAARGMEALEEQFSLEGKYSFHSCEPDGHPIVAAYALPEEYAEEKPVPFIIRLIGESSGITDYNKVLFHYNLKKQIAHVVICTGNELKLANSFKADSFESALYFLFLSIKQLQMNPRQCTIMVCSEISEQQEETIARFFNGVERNNLDNLILL